jgi:hypothetical protein
MQVHCFDVASGQNEPGAFALLGADRAKNISRSVIASKSSRSGMAKDMANLLVRHE